MNRQHWMMTLSAIAGSQAFIAVAMPHMSIPSRVISSAVTVGINSIMYKNDESEELEPWQQFNTDVKYIHPDTATKANINIYTNLAKNNIDSLEDWLDTLTDSELEWLTDEINNINS